MSRDEAVPTERGVEEGGTGADAPVPHPQAHRLPPGARLDDLAFGGTHTWREWFDDEGGTGASAPVPPRHASVDQVSDGDRWAQPGDGY